MTITSSLIRQLRGKAHHLKPIIIIGQHGFTPAVQIEIDNALQYHELIKVRINALDRSQRLQIAESICQQTGATLIQNIGHIAVLYRLAKKEE